MMDEIRGKIDKLNTDEEILQFVIQRLNELEEESVEKTVGQNHGDSFRDYISEKVHFKPTDGIGEKECPDLVYDDRTPYFDLIKEIKTSGGYTPQSILTPLSYLLYKYLPNNRDLWERFQLYKSNTSGRVSVTEVKEKRVAHCSETSGLAHNMFKFLGIDSEFVSGTKNGEPHAYNFIYPRGYDSEPMVLYDPNDFLNFVNGSSKRSFAFYKAFKEDDYDKFMTGEPIQIDFSTTEADYRRMYEPIKYLDGYDFAKENCIYTFGNKDQKEY